MNNLTVSKRQDFVILFDVQNGNPNGDPDAGNQPRIDPETMRGLVTDVCLKRKVRDYVAYKYGYQSGNDIFIKSDTILNQTMAALAEEKDLKKREDKQDRRTEMCKKFFDVRTFGAVMTTGDYNSGQVRGPVQLTFSQSIDPIFPLDLAITRVAFTEESEERAGGSQMGRKNIVPYGLYKGYGYFSPKLAADTGFSNEDLSLLYESLQNMFEIDRSASRGMMSTRGLYVFCHESELGNAHAHQLFELITIRNKKENSVPRLFSDYIVEINETGLPEKVSLIKIVG